MISDFDDIRPYTDAELPEALARVCAAPSFPMVARFLYPDTSPEILAAKLGTVRSIDELQMSLMRDLIERIMATSMTAFTYSGLDNISTAEPHLFISNHRDITLDAFLLQYVLRLNGHGTNYITFGANLMEEPLITELGKCNKMFRVERGGTRAQFYNALLHLSDFIRYVLTEERQSLWTAQRNGRTKDGRDMTDPSILKMFARSSKLTSAKALAPLNITPVAVSYEWEPCDMQKTIERCITNRDGVYHKRPNEDVDSILSGIRDFKGRVHISIGKPLRLDELQSLPATGFYEAAAALVDRQIFDGYKLFPNNYIAHDMRSGAPEYALHYTDEERQLFARRLNKLHALLPDDNTAEAIFLDIYANPVDFPRQTAPNL